MRPPYGVDTEAQAYLDQLLKMAGKAGLKAVIAFRTGLGCNEYAFRYQNDYDPQFAQHLYEPLWNSADPQTAFVAMIDTQRPGTKTIAYRLELISRLMFSTRNTVGRFMTGINSRLGSLLRFVRWTRTCRSCLSPKVTVL